MRRVWSPCRSTNHTLPNNPWIQGLSSVEFEEHSFGSPIFITISSAKG